MTELKRIQDKVGNYMLVAAFLAPLGLFYVMAFEIGWWWYVALPIAIIVFILCVFFIAVADEPIAKWVHGLSDKSSRARYKQLSYERSVNLNACKPVATAFSARLNSRYRAGFILENLNKTDSPLRKTLLELYADPRIYGPECIDLRIKLLQSGEDLHCVICGALVSVDIEKIESDIKENQRLRTEIGANTLVVFDPDWSKGALCKKEKALLCGKCSHSAVTAASQIDTPRCPKCRHELHGLDHITD